MGEIIWKLDDLLEGKKPDELVEELKKKVEEFMTWREKLKPDISVEDMKKIILLSDKIHEVGSRVSGFYFMKFSEDTADPEILAKMSFLSQLITELNNEMLFFDIWLINLDEKNAKRLIESDELKDYKYHLVNIRKAKPHYKTEEIEKIIGLKSITGGSAFSKLYDVIGSGYTFEVDGKEMGQEEALALCQGPDPKLREAAYEAVMGKYGENKAVFTEIYKNIVLDWYNEGIKIRGHKTPIGIRNYNNDIDDKAVEALLKVVRKNSKLFSDYFKLKHDIQKKAGNDYPLSRYHLYAPYVAGEIKEYDYETSKKIVMDTWKSFNPVFYDAAKKIFDAEHVHAFPKKGKRTGAYCYGVHSNATPYIMLNHTNRIRDLFTMIHEFGHGVHDVLSMGLPNLVYSCALPMAETASVFGEMLLADRLLNETDEPEEKKEILTYLLDSQWATITRQTFFVLFENFAHEKIKEGATQEDLDKEYMKILKEQFGEMEVPDVFRNEWNYLPHIHHTPFYCYAYSWGNLLVLALFAMYREEGDVFVKKYMELLSAGGSDAPEVLLAKLGIDPKKEEFWQKGFDIIKEEIDLLKSLA